MKTHIMLALGLLMAVIFGFRSAQELLAPGFGLRDIYNFGGLVIAGTLLFQGMQAFRAERAAKKLRALAPD